MKASALTLAAIAALALARSAAAATYEVGPGQALATIGEVPWEKLQPGDTVLIHARPEPYREKFVIGRTGRADAPITVRGVPGADGQLPVLEGDGATTRRALNYWGDARSLIKIGGTRNPPDSMPQYIVIENLDIRDARPPFTFVGADGKTNNYLRHAAGIQVEKGEHITIRHCVLHDCGNGLFVSSSEKQASRDILVEGNYIYDNGNPGSGQEHNVYTEAVGIIFQFNRFGPPRAKSLGNNLKDRSAGLVVRYNWIEGGNQELDLVDGNDSALVRREPSYRETFVYGNVILKQKTSLHPFVVHYGGDGSQSSTYRKGTLYFYNNTVVSARLGTTLLRLSSDDERCVFANNIVHVLPPRGVLNVADNRGKIDVSHNWFKTGWLARPPAGLHDDGTSLTGAAPGFVDLAAQDFHLTANSPGRGAGKILDGEPFRSHPVNQQYVRHQSGEACSGDGPPDLGAYSSPRSVSSSSSKPR
jgi:hypothetical protein